MIPAVGSGLASMARTGQLERLFVHLGRYAEAFEVSYVTWGDPDEEARLWKPFHEQTDARLVQARGWRVPTGGYDLVRSMNLLGTLPALLSGTPVVMSYGADYPRIAAIHGRPAWKWRALRAVAVRRARAVLVSNPQLARELRRLYPRASIIDHPNWVDPERFRPVEGGERWTRMRPRVYYVGRLVREKHLLVGARAVQRVGARFVCVGEGPLAEDLRREGVELVGAQPWSSLPHWLADAEAFLLPSLTEGHPKALLEAMACGVPAVVSTGVDGIPPEVARMTAPEEMRLAEALWDLLSREDEARALGARARQWVVERFDIGRLMPVEVGILREAAAR